MLGHLLLHHWWSPESQTDAPAVTVVLPQLIKAAKRYIVSWDRGGLGIADITSILSSFGFSEAVGFQTLQRRFTPASSAWAPPTLRLLSDINIHRLLYFFSSSSIFSLGRVQHRDPNTVPRTLTLFKLDQKSELPGKQQIRNLFSAQHRLTGFPSSSPQTLLASSTPVLSLSWKIFQPILNSLQ